VRNTQLWELLYAEMGEYCFLFPKPVNFTGLAGVAHHLVLPHEALFPFAYCTSILMANFYGGTFKRTVSARYCFVHSVE